MHVGDDALQEGKLHSLSRHAHTQMRQQRTNPKSPHKRSLAAHIGPRKKQEVLRLMKAYLIRNRSNQQGMKKPFSTQSHRQGRVELREMPLVAKGRGAHTLPCIKPCILLDEAVGEILQLPPRPEGQPA